MQPRSPPEANQSLLKRKALHSFLIMGVAQAGLQPLCSHEHPASAFQAARVLGVLQHARPLHLSERLCLPLLGLLKQSTMYEAACGTSIYCRVSGSWKLEII